MRNAQTLLNGIWITILPHVAQLYSPYLLNRKKTGDAANYKAITEPLLQTCCLVLKGWCPSLVQSLHMGHLPITHKGVLTPTYTQMSPALMSFLAGFEGSSPDATSHPQYPSFSSHFSAFLLFSPTCYQIKRYHALQHGVAIWHLIAVALLAADSSF